MLGFLVQRVQPKCVQVLDAHFWFCGECVDLPSARRYTLWAKEGKPRMDAIGYYTNVADPKHVRSRLDAWNMAACSGVATLGDKDERWVEDEEEEVLLAIGAPEVSSPGWSILGLCHQRSGQGHERPIDEERCQAARGGRTGNTQAQSNATSYPEY